VVVREVVLTVSLLVPPVVIARVSAADEYNPVFVSLLKLYAGFVAVPSKAVSYTHLTLPTM
jgi:hypothetical protein